MSERRSRILFGVGLLAGVLPLWVSRQLPMVDLGQHLHLISVLHRLGDATTLYPELFELRGQLTPYLGYYHSVSLLHWLLPLETANRVFLSAYVAGMPLGLAFLLRSLGRPAWPALLALPFAYGDSFAWGFVNYCSALPLAFVTCGLFVRAIADGRRRQAWAAGLAVSLVLVLLFHVQVFAYLGLALPWLLLTTHAPEDAPGQALGRRLLPRRFALAAVVPGVGLFFAWVGLRLGEPSRIEYGAPWKAWGPLLSEQNLAYKPFQQNLSELTQVVANMLHDRSDRYGFQAAALVALIAVAWWVVTVLPGAGALGGSRDWRGLARYLARPPGTTEGPIERWRMLGLALISLGLYFALPFDIRGYMYYLNTRYAHLAWPLALAAVPVVRRRGEPLLLAGAVLAALVLGLPLARGFSAFGKEAAAVDRLVEATGERPRVMGLMFNPGSAVVTHPVYLHASTVLARERGGVTNFSFALTPHSPLKYRGDPPPTFPSEWRPHELNYAVQGRWYDHFLIRGAHPAQILGQLLSAELELAAQADGFWLVRRR